MDISIQHNYYCNTTLSTAHLPPLDMQSDVVLGVESDIVPLCDHPDIPVVCILPARQLLPLLGLGLLLAADAGTL